MNKVRNSIILATLTFVPLIINLILHRRYRRLKKALKCQEKFYYNVIFINMRNVDCKQHLISRKECGNSCSYVQLQKILHFVSSAKVSICVCMYMLTLKQFSQELIKAHKRGVKIRVILDLIMANADAAQYNISKFIQNDIIYKHQVPEYSMMHHKFCLIDKEDSSLAKMFFGSMNLTGQAMVYNFETVILTNNSHVIQRYSDEFEDLWNYF
ncbi:unnamed protein product [Acanthoscelides obtectus]|uniref:Mitochondrial cardiolipin hydrolase n=1 Tax=Acanthoscelides obtectus TaxID=200917 RepID=A0A9P0JYU4_ACAOB|nr:unnamed protein product [Acanthoscelides obtectus]CAH1996342.1 unnamed protein product [Acanthoscelides obtectus]CAK1638169.1 Mitochondrial cardiolipin hydrolase [Acanthoscelides obtectus]CAK1663862.1 Mitochondrial cardiolipin hydrolase [Acanthoscelides obtectus]